MGMNNIENPAPSQYVVISTATTTTIQVGVGAVCDGVIVSVAGTGSAVTIYDNNAASGTILVNAAATTTANTFIPCGPGDGVAVKSGYLTYVTTGSPAATILGLYEPSLP